MRQIAILRDYRAGWSMDMMDDKTGPDQFTIMIDAYVPVMGQPNNYVPRHWTFKNHTVADHKWASLLKEYERDIRKKKRLQKSTKKLWVPPISKEHRYEDEAYIMHVDIGEVWLFTFGPRTWRKRRWEMRANWWKPSLVEEGFPTRQVLVPVSDITKKEILDRQVDAVEDGKMTQQINGLWTWVAKVMGLIA
jgi:hypothetical protein